MVFSKQSITLVMKSERHERISAMKSVFHALNFPDFLDKIFTRRAKKKKKTEKSRTQG